MAVVKSEYFTAKVLNSLRFKHGPYNLIPPIFWVMIGQDLMFCPPTWPTYSICFENVRQLKQSQGKKCGPQLSHRQPPFTYLKHSSLPKRPFSWKYEYRSNTIWWVTLKYTWSILSLHIFIIATKMKKSNYEINWSRFASNDLYRIIHSILILLSSWLTKCG